jgi:hypothetical protein
VEEGMAAFLGGQEEGRHRGDLRGEGNRKVEEVEAGRDEL